MNPKLVKVFCQEYTQHMIQLRKDRNTSLRAYQKELQKLNREEGRMIQAIKDGFASEQLKEDMNRLVARKKELEKLLSNQKEPETLIHPGMSVRYKEEVNELIEALNHEDRRSEAGELIRSLIDKIVLTPDPDSNQLLINLYGDIAGILNMSKDKKREDFTEEELKKVSFLIGNDNRNGKRKEKVVAGVHTELRKASKEGCQVKLVAGAHNYRDLHFINIYKKQILKEVRAFINESSTCFHCKA